MTTRVQTKYYLTAGEQPGVDEFPTGTLYVNLPDRILGVVDDAGAPVPVVDGANFVGVAGGRLTGPLMYAGLPQADDELVNLQYVTQEKGDAINTAIQVATGAASDMVDQMRTGLEAHIENTAQSMTDQMKGLESKSDQRDDALNQLVTARPTHGEASNLARQVVEEALQRLYPVGSLYMSAVSTDPAQLLGFGTWQRYANGRALVGAGHNGASNWPAGQTRGAEKHHLHWDEMPEHRHWTPGQNVTVSGTTGGAGGHSHMTLHTQAYNPWGYGPGTNNYYIDTTFRSGAVPYSFTSPVGDHAHAFTGTGRVEGLHTQMAGYGHAHNNVQPSISIYVWRRTR